MSEWVTKEKDSMTDQYYGGIEGGATASTICVVNSKGEIIGTSVGALTNPWLVGVDKCLETIHELIVDVKRKSGLDESTPLQSMGLSLSGGETESMQKEMIKRMLTEYPNDSKAYNMCTDTYGALFTAVPAGIVVISGTGHNTMLVNPDGSVHHCGGWGYMLADEGSAYFIAYRAVKTCLDHDDGLVRSEFDMTFIRSKIFEYFKVSNWFEILPVFFSCEKRFIAKFCLEVMQGARNGEKFCQHLFYLAGRYLGRSIVAVCGKADSSLFYDEKSIQVLIVGSVFKSFDLLRDGFMEGLRPKYEGDVTLKGIRLVKLTTNAAVGAAVLGGREIKVEIPIDYSKNVETVLETKLNEDL